MNDDRLSAALGVLRTARMSDASARRIREQLDRAWREGARPRPRRFAVPAFVPVFAAITVAALLFGVTLRAGADSALYGARIAIEDALVALHTDVEDRLEYVRELYDERTEEAARQEAVGNALAAGKARVAQNDALRMLNTVPPKDDEPTPTPSAIVAVPEPTPTATPTTTPTASPTPVRIGAPAATHTPTPTGTSAPKPTPSYFTVIVTAGILNPDGTPADNVCVTTAAPTLPTPTPSTSNCAKQFSAGSVQLTMPGRLGQSVTLYFWRYDTATGRVLKAAATFTITGSRVSLGTIKLQQF